jgi:formylglycine-generating enzyme
LTDIFISYAREDRSRVKPLVDALQRRGWSVWWDHTILTGKTWDQIIEAALDNARCVIVLWSRISIASHWVLTEAHEAQARGILLPALLDDVRIPLAFRRFQTANLANWPDASSDEFDILVLAIAAVLADAAPVPAMAPVAGQTRTNPKDGLAYMWIPPGKFTMGCSPGDDKCYDSERPAHDVEIAKGFWLGQTPVTQAAYRRVTGRNPSNFKGANLPVETVSWDDAQAYCQGIGGRLPTEAEWEYAARAGTAGPRHGDLDRVAWHHGNSGGKTHEVGQKQPNAWGLHDTLGNLWEWVADWFGEAYYQLSAKQDPSGPPAGEARGMRGGSWDDGPRVGRAPYRGYGGPGTLNARIGFRCVAD